MENFSFVIIYFLSVIGIASVLKWLCFLFYKKQSFDKSVFIICLEDKDFEMTIRSAYNVLKWYPCTKSVLAFDNGLSQQNKQSATALLNDYNFSFISEESLKDIFNE